MSDQDPQSFEELMRSGLRERAQTCRPSTDAFAKVGLAEQRLARVRKVRSTTGIVAALCSVGLVIGVVAGTGGSGGAKGSPAGTSVPTPRPVAVITPANGAHVLLIRVDNALEVLSPTGRVLKKIDLRLPASFSATGVDRAGMADSGTFTAVTGDGTAFAAYGVVRQLASTLDIVAVSLRDGRESVFAQGGNPVLSPNGTYLAWQSETKVPEAQLSSTLVVENLKTGYREQLSAIPGRTSSATAVDEAATMRLAWSPNSLDLAISYETAEPSPGEERIVVLQIDRALSQSNPRKILPLRNFVGDNVAGMSWLNSDNLLLAGNDYCAAPKIDCSASTIPNQIVLGPVFAEVNVTSGAVEPDMSGNLFQVQCLSTDPATDMTVVVGVSPASPNSILVEQFGHPPLLKLSSFSWVAWISDGSTVSNST